MKAVALGEPVHQAAELRRGGAVGLKVGRELGHEAVEQLLGRGDAEHVTRRLVALDDATGHPRQQQAVGAPLEHLPEPSLGRRTRGDVLANRENALGLPVAIEQAGDVPQKRLPRAVGQERVVFEAGGGRAGQHLDDVGAHRGSLFLGDEVFDVVAAQRSLAGHAEQFLRRPVPLEDGVVGPQREDDVRRGVEERTEPVVAGLGGVVGITAPVHAARIAV